MAKKLKVASECSSNEAIQRAFSIENLDGKAVSTEVTAVEIIPLKESAVLGKRKSRTGDDEPEVNCGKKYGGDDYDEETVRKLLSIMKEMGWKDKK